MRLFQVHLNDGSFVDFPPSHKIPDDGKQRHGPEYEYAEVHGFWYDWVGRRPEGPETQQEKVCAGEYVVQHAHYPWDAPRSPMKISRTDSRYFGVVRLDAVPLYASPEQE